MRRDDKEEVINKEVSRGRGFDLNVELMSSKVVHEGLNQEACGEIEDEAERDGDGQRRQGFLEDGQEQ